MNIKLTGTLFWRHKEFELEILTVIDTAQLA
jgi:hypothetical protein